MRDASQGEKLYLVEEVAERLCMTPGALYVLLSRNAHALGPPMYRQRQRLLTRKDFMLLLKLSVRERRRGTVSRKK